MKKLLLTMIGIACCFSNCSQASYADPTTHDKQLEQLRVLEMAVFGKARPQLSDESRLRALEISVFDSFRRGTVDLRLEELTRLLANTGQLAESPYDDRALDYVLPRHPHRPIHHIHTTPGSADRVSLLPVKPLHYRKLQKPQPPDQVPPNKVPPVDQQPKAPSVAEACASNNPTRPDADSHAKTSTASSTSAASLTGKQRIAHANGQRPSTGIKYTESANKAQTGTARAQTADNPKSASYSESSSTSPHYPGFDHTTARADQGPPANISLPLTQQAANTQTITYLPLSPASGTTNEPNSLPVTQSSNSSLKTITYLPVSKSIAGKQALRLPSQQTKRPSASTNQPRVRQRTKSNNPQMTVAPRKQLPTALNGHKVANQPPIVWLKPETSPIGSNRAAKAKFQAFNTHSPGKNASNHAAHLVGIAPGRTTSGVTSELGTTSNNSGDTNLGRQPSLATTSAGEQQGAPAQIANSRQSGNDLVPATEGGPCETASSSQPPPLSSINDGTKDNTEAMLKKALSLLEGGSNSKAERAFNELLRLNGPNAEAHFHLGVIAEKTGNLPKALEHYKDALDLQPNDPRFREVAKEAEQRLYGSGKHVSNSGHIATQRNGKIGQPAKYYQENSTTQSSSSESAEQLVELAIEQYKQSNFGHAITFLERLANELPNDASVQFALARAHQAKGDLQGAELCIAKALANDPNNELYKNELQELQLQFRPADSYNVDKDRKNSKNRSYVDGSRTLPKEKRKNLSARKESDSGIIKGAALNEFLEAGPAANSSSATMHYTDADSTADDTTRYYY